MKEKDGEITELTHDPVPGYRTALFVVIAVAVSYLAALFIWG